jgi:hypothetical protein
MMELYFHSTYMFMEWYTGTSIPLYIKLFLFDLHTYLPYFRTGLGVAPEKYGKNIGTVVASALWEEGKVAHPKALLQPIQTLQSLSQLV